MPIASGAAGRVDVGVDTSLTWTPDGMKRRTKPTNRHCDSYLQRYQELKQRQNKSHLWPAKQDVKDPSDHEHHGAEEENPQHNYEDKTPGVSSSEQSSKKSVLCVIL